jgi:hypothetical protein
VICDDRIADVDVLRDGIGTNVLMVRGGGYPTRERSISSALRAQIIERDRGRCVLCDAAGTDIDHIAGSSKHPRNLRLTCKSCNGDLMARNVVTVTNPDDIARLKERDSRLAQRVAVDTPLRVCDDEINWGKMWRSFKRAAAAPGN